MNNLQFLENNRLTPARRNLFAIIAISIIVLSIYSNSLNSSWHYDDHGMILGRPSLHLDELSWEKISKTLFRNERSVFVNSELGTLYRPVANLTLALNYYFGQTDVLGYHLVNISIHIVSSIFLFLLIFHTLSLPMLKEKYGRDAYFIALLSALLWAVNPVQSQAVNYIVQRMASMAGMFYIMAIYFYVKGRTSEKCTARLGHYLMLGVCGLLAIGSKENAVMLPFSILLFDLFLVQGITKGNVKKSTWFLIGLIAVPLLAALILRGPSLFSLEGFERSYELKRPFTVMERLLTQPYVILFYLSLLFYPMPQRLSLCHDVTISQGLFDPLSTLLSICVIGVILTLCAVKAKQWPLICYCIVFFFLNHIIEGSVFGLDLIYEHRNYVPSILLFIPVAIVIIKGIRHFSAKKYMQVALSGFAVLVLVGFGHSTFIRNFAWKTEGTLWADAAEKAPDLLRPQNNMGFHYYLQGSLEDAILHFKVAESGRILNNITDPGLPLYNLGLCYSRLGDQDLALEYYKRAEKAYPNLVDNLINMGALYTKKGMHKEAIKAYGKSLKYDKDGLIPRRNLSLALLKVGKVQEGIMQLEKALKVKKGDHVTLGLLGYAYRLEGRFDKAYGCFKKAIEAKSYDPRLLLYLAEIYFERNMEEKAQTCVRTFMKGASAEYIAAYLNGIGTEASMQALQTYKEPVMELLAKEYERNAENSLAKAKGLREMISNRHADLGGNQGTDMFSKYIGKK